MPLAVTRPRKRRRNRSARLTRRQIHAIHTAVTTGDLTLPELCRRGWKQWGYASEQSAYTSIRVALILDGLLEPAVRCSCGVEFDDRTPGCSRCRERHKSRRRLGLQNVSLGYEWHKDIPCAGCGCHVDARTTGCENCRWRHNQRRSYARLKETA